MEDSSTDPRQSPISPLNRVATEPGTTMSQSRSRSRTSSGGSGPLRNASLRFLESDPPLGAWHAAGEALGKAPTHGDIRRGSFSNNGWDANIQRRNSVISGDNSRRLTKTSTNTAPTPGNNPSGLRTHNETEDESEIFSSFTGRGEMSDQVYSRKPPGYPKDRADEDDDLAPDQDRPLPKKFQDPSLNYLGEVNEKTTTIGGDQVTRSSTPSLNQGPDADGVYPNGYKFPPKHTRKEALAIGFKGFCKYAITPVGFLVVVYCLNVVAWGGMLFLLLIGGGKQYMCYPEHLHGIKDCGNLYSPRRIWIEIDSQILNALFCVTGLGLIPWRFRDLYYLLQFRLLHKHLGLRRLGGIHNGWFRLPGSTELPVVPKASYLAEETDNPALPIPTSKIPDGPLTGIRAQATLIWKLDFVIWAMVLNTFLQCVLCGFMWGYNRFTRPSWATGTFIALACIVAGLGGLMTFLEAKKVKAVEGIPPDEEAVPKDIEEGVELKSKRTNDRKDKRKRNGEKI